MKTLLTWPRVALLALVSLFSSPTRATVPGIIHYQGLVTVTNAPYSGPGWFRFALVDRTGTNTFWSHDGSSVGGAVPATEVRIPVTDGLYSVLLGDRDIAGMTQTIPATVFAENTSVYLRVWFDDHVHGVQQFSPDTRIVAVGYALVAAKLASGAITDDAFRPNVTLGGANTSGTLTLKSGGDQTRAVLDAGWQTGTGSLELFDATGAFSTARLVGAEFAGTGAQLLLKNGSGNTTLELDAQDGATATAGGVIRLKKNDGANVLTVEADLDNGNSGLLLFNASGAHETVRMTGALQGTKGGFLSLKNANGTPTLQFDAQLDAANPSGGGNLIAGNGAYERTAELTGDGGEGQGKLILKHADQAARVVVDGDGVNNGGELKVYDSDGTMTVNLRGAAGLTQGALLELSKADGTPTIILSAEANGEGKITTQVLQITGGSDLSEQFDIGASSEGLVRPGAIVCIDPANPGELRVSDRAYDVTVAGIISGAGDVKPGMLMGQAGTRADGQHPVALTGRVYCQIDASHGAVRPGDLITTSPTPGHGMKADPAKAPGAIIGKAMTPLEDGRGLVLVLVSLQ